MLQYVITVLAIKKTYIIIPVINVLLVIAFDSYAVIITTAIVSTVVTAIFSLLVALYLRNSGNRIQERKEFRERLDSAEERIAVLAESKADTKIP